MVLTISGASGFIGRRLLRDALTAGHEVRVLSRHAGTNVPAGVRVFPWDPVKGPPPPESLRAADAILHLAGEPVAQRWTAETRRRIRDSRVIGTRNLVEGLRALDRRPHVLVSSSAVGYYGSRGDDILRESDPPADDWLAGVCVEWERAAQEAEALDMRAVRIRTGLVLDPRGGALKRMLPPFRMGIGGPLGNGKQWSPWIHLADLAALFQFAVDHPVRGAVNGVAPFPVTNADFTRELGKALGRPAVLPMPAFALKLLFGEMSQILLGSQRAVPAAAEAAGFRFRYPQLGAALANLFSER